MKYSELVEIRECLTVLGKKEQPIWYEIAKNLQKVRKVTDKIEDLMVETNKKFASKDENGDYVLVKDKMQTPNGPQPYDRYVFEGPNKLAHRTAMDAIEKDDSWTIEFHKISISRLKDTNQLGSIMAPLLDIIFINDAEVVGK